MCMYISQAISSLDGFEPKFYMLYNILLTSMVTHTCTRTHTCIYGIYIQTVLMCPIQIVKKDECHAVTLAREHRTL